MRLPKPVVVCVVTTLALLSAVPVIYAELNAPRLRARSRSDGTVRLSWSGVRAGRDVLAVLEIERGGAPDATVPLMTIAPRPRRYFDAPPAAGVYWYRARVVADTAISPWSAPVAAEVEAPRVATPTPVATPSATPDPSGSDPALEPGQRECRDGAIEDTLALVNDARRAAGMPVLRENADLRWAARVRTITMAATQQLSHDGWVEVIRDSGYRSGTLAENIAAGYWSPLAVVDGWLASSGHRGNILSAAFRDTGIGCVIDENGRLWWTQNFGG